MKALGVNNLIIERGERIGDIWRHRYEYLSLHFPHWADHLPYFPFPERWPTYTPAQKMGLFMEWYASALELAVWTSSTVTEARQDEHDHWHVSINKGGEQRAVKAKHLVSSPAPKASTFQQLTYAHQSSLDYGNESLRRAYYSHDTWYAGLARRRVSTFLSA